MTPLATVTPRLEQEFRFDVFSETLPTHAHLDNYGAGKGLEITPTENTEIIIGAPPPYETRRSNVGKTLADGWADWPALLVKYRFLECQRTARQLHRHGLPPTQCTHRKYGVHEPFLHHPTDHRFRKRLG
jgi:hypothetical protein